MMSETEPFPRPARQAVLDYVTSARWFGGKGRNVTLENVIALPWLTDAGQWPALRVEIVQLRYDAETDEDDASGGDTELYQLPIAYYPAPQPDLQRAEVDRVEEPELGAVVGYDVALDPQASRQLVELLVSERRVRDDDDSVTFRLTDADPLTGFLRSDEQPQVFTGQQSNTSIMYGDVAMLKLFRRLELGRNLDIEVHNALRQAGLSDIAQLHGWIEASWHQDDVLVQADLAMIVERFRSVTDGWELALDSLRSGESFAPRASTLGRALAEIHGALAQQFPTSITSGAELAVIMNARLEQAITIVPALSEHGPGLQRCFAALDGLDVATQRVHGDFHLGQTLESPEGWKIIDFEGEPVKSLAERSVPDSRWRDVAGMLRSFDYAAATEPSSESGAWATASRAAFLDGYGGDLPAEQQTLLRAYEADKAIYEVVYEERNRPDWVNIPLAAVAAIATEE